MIKGKLKAGSLSYYNDKGVFVTIKKADGLVEVPEALYKSKASMFENAEIKTSTESIDKAVKEALKNMISKEDHDKLVDKAVKEALKDAEKQSKLDLKNK